LGSGGEPFGPLNSSLQVNTQLRREAEGADAFTLGCACEVGGQIVQAASAVAKASFAVAWPQARENVACPKAGRTLEVTSPPAKAGRLLKPRMS
jgi:hypothetical protein